MILTKTDGETPEVMSRAEFSLLIEQYAADNQLHLVGAILDICELYDIDFVNIKRMITDGLKEKIAVSEHIESAVFGKSAKLPIVDE